MSTVPPSLPQGAPGQPYPPYPPPKKGVSPIVWVLLGLGVFVMICVLAVVGAGFFFVHKAKQAGLDTDLMKRNPTLAAVKMMAALNPDIDVVSMDDQKGIVVVREKKTGKSYTVNLEDARNGRFVLKEDGKEAVTITTHNGGDGNSPAVDIKSSDGTIKLGGDAGTKIPAWVPEYPGSSPQGGFSTQTSDGNTGSYAFKTKDALDKVAGFYEQELKSSGMKTTSTISRGDGGTTGGMLSGEAGNKSLVVLLGTENGETTVSVTYKAGK